eukprot:41653_1
MSALQTIDNILLQIDKPKNNGIVNKTLEQLKNFKIDCINCDLRFVKESDAEQLANMVTKDVVQYLRRMPYPYNINHAKWWVNMSKKNCEKYAEFLLSNDKDEKEEYFAFDAISFQIVNKENDSIIGGMGVMRNSLEHHRAEVGFWLNDNYWNKGIMTKALNGFISFIWNNDKNKYDGLNIKLTLNTILKLDAEVAAPNVNSEKVLKKCGFEYEGTIKRGTKLKNDDGKICDIKVYGLLK